MATKFIQAQSFAITSAGAALGDTTLTLQSFKQIDGTTNIVTADLGDYCFGTIEPNNGTQEEATRFTGVTQNANGTATLTGVYSVGFVSPYTATSGLAKSHAGGATFILSNDAGFYNQFATPANNNTWTGSNTFTQDVIVPLTPSVASAATSKYYITGVDALTVHLASSETITGAKTFTVLPTIPATPSASTDAASKGYVDGVAFAGAPNASTSVKGIVQEATQAQVDATLATGSTGARLYVNPSTLPAIPQFDFATSGDGTVVLDGTATFSFATLATSTSTYTLTRDLFCTSATLASGITLKNGGYIIHATNTLTNNGVIDNSGLTGGAGGNASAGVHGIAGTGGVSGSGVSFAAPVQATAGRAGQSGSGTNGINGTAVNPSVGSSGANGASGNSGGGAVAGTGGTGGSATAENAVMSYTYRTQTLTASAEINAVQFLAKIVGATSGLFTVSAGGGGVGASSDNSGGYAGGGGGTGGTGGGVIIVSKTIVNNGTISSNGGTGGAGGSGFGGVAGVGGTGGTGGVIGLIYYTYSGSGSVTVNGGTGGTSSGATGAAGKIYKCKLVTGYSN